MVVSAAIHIVLVILIFAAGTAVHRRSTVDIELVPPLQVTTQRAPVPPPSVPRSAVGAPPGAPIAERAPARRTEPVRSLPPAPRPAPPAPPPAAADLAAPHGADVDPREPAADDDGRRSEAASGGGEGDPGRGEVGDGQGDGGGLGGGLGSGQGSIDLSARPVPLEVNASWASLYTAEALRDRVTGDVQLVLTVDPLGHVGSATVRRGLGHGLDEIATRLAMQIRFRPARDRAGKPTVGTVRWRFHFQPP